VCKEYYESHKEQMKEKSKLYHNNSQDILAKIDVENDKIKNNNDFIDGLNVNLKAKVDLLKSFDEERDRLNSVRINNVDTEMYKVDEDSIMAVI
jgi:hypothetical protein